MSYKFSDRNGLTAGPSESKSRPKYKEGDKVILCHAGQVPQICTVKGVWKRASGEIWIEYPGDKPKYKLEEFQNSCCNEAYLEPFNTESLQYLLKKGNPLEKQFAIDILRKYAFVPDYNSKI